MSAALASPVNRTEKAVRVKRKLLKRFNLIWVVQSLLAQIFRFPFTRNQWLFRAVSTRQEGRIAIVTDAGRDVVDATASALKMVAGRVELVSGLLRAGRTTLLSPSTKLRRTCTKPGEAFGEDGFAYGKTVWS
jgi:hypothetical protein